MTRLPANNTRVDLREADYSKLAAWAAQGVRKQDAAARLGVTDRTLRRIFERDERAASAWATGHAELHERLVAKLVEKALNGEVAPLIFSLKSIFGYRDQGPHEGEQQAPAVVINLPAAVSRENFEKLVEVRATSQAKLPENSVTVSGDGE